MAAKRILIGRDGDDCPRCGNPTTVWKHAEIKDKHRRQPYYYSQWFECMNGDCSTTQIMPKRYIVWNDASQKPPEGRRMGKWSRPPPASQILENEASDLAMVGRGPLPGEKPPWDE